ncbi:hypothetical protein [Olivibacter jilunii]|uniref:hypothetical protein n=1 Tax=Olivibacter jilunii TaxID=985016 RepID=UPI001030AFB1|nr:hypothetical protein [Olivibacter jilunii]
MYGLKRVKLPNASIQEIKLNYFAEMFQFNLYGYSVLADKELDNLPSLLHKILFHLRTNPVKQANKYIRIYVEKFLQLSEGYLNDFEGHQDIMDLFKRYLNTGKPLSLALLLDGRSKLESLFDVLEKQFLLRNLESVIKMIQCGCDLSVHKTAINICIDAITSELLLKRRSQREVAGLFSEIFTDDYLSFPYPTEVSEEEKKSYFQNRGLNECLKAIHSFYDKEERDMVLIFRIGGIAFSPDTIFKHNNIQFLSSNHESMSSFHDFLARKKETIREWFELNEGDTLCLVPVRSVTVTNGINLALDRLRPTLSYIERIIDCRLILEKDAVFDTEDMKLFGWRLTAKRGSHLVSHYDLERLQDNAYEFFAGCDSQAKVEFLNQEPKFVEARLNTNVGLLWSYLEGLLTDVNDTGIIEVISQALILHEEEWHGKMIASYVRNVLHPINTSAEDIGLTYEEVLNYGRRPELFDELVERASVQSLKDIIKRRRITKNILLRHKKYYEHNLLEAYDLRNQRLHGNKINNRSHLKMKETFPLLVGRFRTIIFEYAEKYPNYNLGSIFKKIGEDYATLFNQSPTS